MESQGTFSYSMLLEITLCLTNSLHFAPYSLALLPDPGATSPYAAATDVSSYQEATPYSADAYSTVGVYSFSTIPGEKRLYRSFTT
jgi:hypothetical protein